MKHKLIVLEGIDNVGKTSSTKLLVSKLLNHGIPAIYHKTPPEQFAETTRVINDTAFRDAHFLYRTYVSFLRCSRVIYSSRNTMLPGLRYTSIFL